MGQLRATGANTFSKTHISGIQEGPKGPQLPKNCPKWAKWIQEDMSYCSTRRMCSGPTRRRVFLLNKKTCRLVEQGDMTSGQEDMSSC